MISLSPEATKLNILLPNNNKALGEVLKNATPKELALLKESSDLKSFLNSLFQDKAISSKSDTILLELLKNSPQFKQLGSFTESIKELLKELKYETKLSTKTEVLENFTKHISNLKAENLKEQISSSGVFMESKLSKSINRLPELTKTLQTLQTRLEQEITQAKNTQLLPKNDLQQDLVKNTLQVTEAIKPQTTLESKTPPLQIQEKNDPLVEKKLEQFQKATNLANEILKSPNIILAKTDFQSAVNLSEQVKSLMQTIQDLSGNKNQPLLNEAILSITQKLTSQTSPNEIRLSLEVLQNSIISNAMSELDEFVDAIEYIKNAPDTSLKHQVLNLSNNLKNTIHYLNETSLENLKIKLMDFNDPNELHLESSIEKYMSKDIKANLLQLKEELITTSNPNMIKIGEAADKILLQIDYHQLYSTLSQTSSLYFPFAWDALEDGKMEFKKAKDKKFYCQIDLTLKEYGELNMLMGLYDKNQLDLQIQTQKIELKDLIQENIATLRSALIDAEITPRSIRVYDSTQTNRVAKNGYATHITNSNAFEVKV